MTKQPCNRFFPESYERFIGIYWGQVSTPFCAETVEASDAYIFAGPIFNDYTRCNRAVTCRVSSLGDREAMHASYTHCTTICSGLSQALVLLVVWMPQNAAVMSCCLGERQSSKVRC